MQNRNPLCSFNLARVLTPEITSFHLEVGEATKRLRWAFVYAKEGKEKGWNEILPPNVHEKVEMNCYYFVFSQQTALDRRPVGVLADE